MKTLMVDEETCQECADFLSLVEEALKPERRYSLDQVKMNSRTEQAAVAAAIQRETLNDYLARWHAWSHPKPMNGTDHLADPAFREADSPRGWETEDEIHARDWLKFVMRTLDFIVTGDDKGQGGMDSPYKDAILIQARNLHTGFNVWVSPRVPRDSTKRLEIVSEARTILMRRMNSAGIPI